MNNSLTRIAAGAASAAALLGATILGAPEASAVSVPKGCVEWAYPQHFAASTAVNFRTGPSSRYTSLGILSKGNRFTSYCQTENGNTVPWEWGKVTSGPNAGKSGWVSYDYLHWA